MRRPPRGDLARYAAPVAFLAAVTVAVVLIRSGLENSGSAVTVPSLPSVSTQAATTGNRTSASQTTTAAAQYYTVQSGDTLGGIAVKLNTSVEQLQGLNPTVDPAALQPGQKIRVK